ncbi:hypothetical protein Agub_g9933, partial [Astrephomene gubernaculifera]
MTPEKGTDSMAHEERFLPPDDILRQAYVQGLPAYQQLYERSISDPDAFWSEQAEALHWQTKWTTPICKHNFNLDNGPVQVSWFEGAETNLAYNAIDRHIEAGLGERVAFYWEGNDEGNERTVTYAELKSMVCRIANYMKSIGIKRGDDVTMYMPLVPELPAVMLACARIGAVHSVVFGGFSAEALADRVLDSRPALVITSSGTMRGPKPIPLKAVVDDALAISEAKGHSVQNVLMLEQLPLSEVGGIMRPGRDVTWREAVEPQPDDCPVEWMPAEAPLFKLYTSGSTGKPKGVLHTTGGYMVGALATTKFVFDIKPATDVYWCTADCGWITGHTYVTYGPLMLGATQVLFEGVPTWPDAGRCWAIVDKYNVSVFYTAPTAIRALHAKGDAYVTRHSRSSLRLLGSVGEPINPEAWRWYHEVVGDSRCPIMDTWWQTETGAHMITPLPGATPLKPGCATLPFFGVEPAVLDEKGNELQGPCEGMLVIKRPWPSMMRTVAGDHNRFEQTYFSAFKGYYFTGDGCRRDADGYYWITGRVDDVLNVSGHRIGTAEVESALVAHPACSEAAVVGYEHAIKGQGIYAFVTLKAGAEPSDVLRKELIDTVRKIIGAFAAPDIIHWAPGLPKTRSGKIMRRVLRKIAAREEEQL